MSRFDRWGGSNEYAFFAIALDNSRTRKGRRVPCFPTHFVFVCFITLLVFLKLLILTEFPTTKNQKSLTIEILVLRHQLAVLEREKPTPELNLRDRLFWVTLSKLWPNWKNALTISKPETVVGRHR